MGENIPTFILVQSKGIISRQTCIQEERASKWVYNPFHLVTSLLETGSSELFNKRDATVDIQILQGHLQFTFAKSLPYSLR